MKKVIMYLSSFIPVFWVIWIKDYINIISKIIDKKTNWLTVFNWNLIFAFILLILITVAFSIMMINNKKLSTNQVKITNIINKSSQYILSYFSLFVLSLMSFSLTKIVDIIVIIILLSMIGFVYIKNELYFINPTINIFQSFIYEIEYEYNGKSNSKIVVSPKKLLKNEIIELYISKYSFAFVKK